MSYAFLEALHAVTDWRIEHGWIVYLLPVAGLGVGFVYHRWGGRSRAGNALLLEESVDAVLLFKIAWPPSPSASCRRRSPGSPMPFAGIGTRRALGAGSSGARRRGHRSS